MLNHRQRVDRRRTLTPCHFELPLDRRLVVGFMDQHRAANGQPVHF
jgi:hypothetical protein